MVNPSRAKGTAAETAVCNAALDVGIFAHRVALAGHLDQGDVWLKNGRIVIEVKAGKQAMEASRAQIDAWWSEAEEEGARVLACDMAVLVVKAKGKGQARDWRAFTTVSDYVALITGHEQVWVDRVIELPLGWLLDDIAQVIA